MSDHVRTRTRTMGSFSAVFAIVASALFHLIGVVHAQSTVTISTTSGNLEGVEQDGGMCIAIYVLL